MKKLPVRRAVAPYALLIPLIVMLALLFASLALSLVQSLGYMPAFGKDSITLEYYQEVFSSRQLIEEIGASLGVAVVSTVLSAVISVLVSWCIVTAFGAKGVLFNITKLPMLVPYTVVCLSIITLLSTTGFVPRVLYALGVEGASEMFDHVLFWPNNIGVVLVFVFHMSSYMIYMITEAMSKISATLGDAALDLGASQWQAFRKVVLPHCMPTVKNAMIFCFVLVFGNYEVPMLIGSATARLLPVHAYFEYSNVNFVAHRPEAMVLNVVMLVLAILAVVAIHCWDVHDRRKRGIA